MTPSREVEALIAYVDAAGIPHRVTATTNHARHTKAGNVSRHVMAGTDGDGLAVDFAGPTPGDRAAMLAIYERLLEVWPQLHELIYGGPGITELVRRRVRVVPLAYGIDVLNAHLNHVHVSVDLGTFLTPKEKPMPDDPNLANMTGPVELHLVVSAEGQCTGYYMFSPATGELHSFGPGAPYYDRSEVVRP
jgi:hypothetical protein